MQIEKSVRAVERLLKEIDQDSSRFLNQVEVRCPTGCNKCCHGKNVAATPLEFLPYAYHLFKTGELEDKYWELKLKEGTSCVLVEGDEHSLTGQCSIYEHRGVICRLFGNCASVDKSGQKQYSACSILKGQIVDKEKFQLTLQASAPVYSNYYMKLRSIDNTHGSMLFPINIAILKSLELVYNNTRRKRKRAV
ncbi:MAG: YkgJ family cysteine cluster protein [Prolixibacteraceae bacterium]|nr:YkgJ family cysteine cluster protein [Prolixibacteraceae bacterium]